MAYADLYLAKFPDRQLPGVASMAVLAVRAQVVQVVQVPIGCRAFRIGNVRELFGFSGDTEMTFKDLQIGDIFRDVPLESDGFDPDDEVEVVQ